MVACGSDLKVNPAYVASLAWDRRHYANGPGDSVLIIMMHDGTQHRVTHSLRPGWGGVDAYLVEKEICAAVARLAAQRSGGEP
jgi:hypothetical protein